MIFKKIFSAFVSAAAAVAVVLPMFPVGASAEEYSCDSAVLKYKLNGSEVVITGFTKADSTVTIPAEIEGAAVTEISKDAFAECEGIVSLTIPDNLVKIGDNAFRGCRQLKSVYIGDSVTEIGSYAFSGCPSLNSFSIGSDNKSFSVKSGMLCSKDGSELIAYAGGSDAVIPISITKIGKAAFFSDTSLKSVKLPSKLKSIGDYAFSGCLSLKEVSIPSTVESIGAGCFMSCSSLERAVLGKSLKAVPNECFSMCTALVSVNFPESVTSVGESAFFSCGKLSGIEIPKTVKTIGKNSIGIHYDMISRSNAPFRDFYICGTTGSAVDKYCKSNKILLIDFENLPYGDVNTDGAVDSRDASLILSEYANTSTGRPVSFSYYQTLVGDYNCDGRINSVDASKVLSQYAMTATGH